MVIFIGGQQMAKQNNFIIEEEFDFLKIGSKHNTKRLLGIMSNMIKNPGKSILSQSSSRSEAKAAYQFFNNENLDMSKIEWMHRYKTFLRIEETNNPILVIQDTTYVNYNTQSKKEDMGKISAYAKGVKIHSSIATTQEGLVLGVLNQLSLSSPLDEETSLSKQQLKSRSIEDKESYRWIESFKESMYLMPDGVDLTVVSDREGDIYEYMNAVISGKRHFLTRIAQNRMTTDNKNILDSIRKEQCQGSTVVSVPRNSGKNQKRRTATLSLRYQQYNIKRPARLANTENLPDSLAVWVIHARETNPPAGIEAIEWFLMTNRPISNMEMAIQQLQNYTHRWKIERFHYVLKTGGCNIEQIQARTMRVTLALIMLYSIISVFIMNMAYAARLNPDQPCSDFFEEEEWQFLYWAVYKTTKTFDKPISIKEAVQLIAWLGSGKRPPSDGVPGLKLIWRGLEKFYFLWNYRGFMKLTVQV